MNCYQQFMSFMKSDQSQKVERGGIELILFLRELLNPLLIQYTSGLSF